MFKTILVPIDGSEHSRDALKVACRLADGPDSQLVLLHVPEELAHEPVLVWGVVAVPADAAMVRREEVGREILAKAEQEAVELNAPATDTIMAHGAPARVILDTARDRGVDAIIMGSRGLGDFSSLVFGSVSHKVSHGADCRVITVH